MPPSGCYFSRDNKNYRLSGLENNRSSGLPPDRGLHSLSPDTQAVAVDVLFLFLFPLPAPAPLLATCPSLVPSLFLLRTISLSSPFLPHPPPSLPSRGQVPHTTPLGSPLSPHGAPAPFLATSPQPVAWTGCSDCLETLSTCSSRLHRTRPLQPAVHYHFTYYTL